MRVATDRLGSIPTARVLKGHDAAHYAKGHRRGSRPSFIPVCLPSARTDTRLMSTCSTPGRYATGSSFVDTSASASKSKTTISAKAPGRTRPRPFRAKWVNDKRKVEGGTKALDGALLGGVGEQRPIRVSVDVDESGADDFASRVDHTLCYSSGERAHLDTAIPFNCD